MPIIGLDLGRRTFRAVELQREKGVSVVRNYGSYDKGDINLNFASEDDLTNYIQKLKDFIREHKFSTSYVVTDIPEQDVFIRTIKTPLMNLKDLYGFIELGAEEYIPIPIKEVTFDAQIIERSDQADGGGMQVLLVASKNNVLAQYVTLLKRAGLTPKGLEPETLSMERVLGDSVDRPSATIIVNIGFQTTQIIITYRGFVRFTRSMSIGGDELTKAVQKDLQLDYIQAEEYKKAYGLDESQVEGKVYNSIRPVFDKILQEINKSKTYYTSRNSDVIINRVILSGGTALMPGLLLYIANKLDVEAELANPWRNIKISETLVNKRTELMAVGPMYSTAVGLALKEV